MESNPSVNNPLNGGADGLACHACGKTSLAGVHTIHPHPLRGASFESVLLNCTRCGTKRLHTRPVQGSPVLADLEA